LREETDDSNNSMTTRYSARDRNPSRRRHSDTARKIVREEQEVLDLFHRAMLLSCDETFFAQKCPKQGIA